MADKVYPEGRIVAMWIGIGMAMFAGLGVPLSIAVESPGLMGIGPAIGAGVGAAIGASIESRYRGEGRIRPLTAGERRQQRWAVIAGAVLLLLGVAFLILLLVR